METQEVEPDFPSHTEHGATDMNIAHNVGVASRIGTYSDGVETRPGVRWLMTSGTPGIDAQGKLPDDFSAQANLAWENVLRIVADAGMGVEDIVKINQSLIRRSDLEAYRPIRTRYLGDARPALMLSFVQELVWPGMLIELEVVAAKAAG
jgi:enamine deaminase RidA (YjgF/YER057c/UK114 family)